MTSELPGDYKRDYHCYGKDRFTGGKNSDRKSGEEVKKKLFLHIAANGSIKIVQEPGTGSMVVFLAVNASKTIEAENAIRIPMDK